MVEVKQEPMEVEEKKPEVKTEVKEEEDAESSGTTSSTQSPQTHKKSKDVRSKDVKHCAFALFIVRNRRFNVHTVFKPEELRQALMPTLEALYRQDPESLPFRQPVDPMLLGIPVKSFLTRFLLRKSTYRHDSDLFIYLFVFIRITLTS